MSETTVTFEINEIGSETGNPFNGTFKVKTLLSRREEFIADERRRSIVGTLANGVAPSLGGEAFMQGQLFVRIVEAPKWWEDSDSGLDLKDLNVIVAVFNAAMKAEKDRKDKVKDDSQKALKKMTKKTEE